MRPPPRRRPAGRVWRGGARPEGLGGPGAGFALGARGDKGGTPAAMPVVKRPLDPLVRARGANGVPFGLCLRRELASFLSLLPSVVV